MVVLLVLRFVVSCATRRPCTLSYHVCAQVVELEGEKQRAPVADEHLVQFVAIDSITVNANTGPIESGRELSIASACVAGRELTYVEWIVRVLAGMWTKMQLSLNHAVV